MIVAPGDSAALATGLLHLIDLGADERRRLGALGRERIRRDFSLPAIADAYRTLYHETLGRQ